MVTKGYGFSVEDIDWSCPADLQPYDDAHQLEVQERDILAWEICGTYVRSAISVAVENLLLGRKARGKYLENPNTFENLTTEKEKPLSYEDAIEEQKFNMTLRMIALDGLPDSPQ